MDNAGGDVAPAVVAEIDVEKSTLPFTAVKDVLFDDVAVSDELRTALLEIDAIRTPVCVYEKMMVSADRLPREYRLRMSFGSRKKKMSFKKIFTKKEMLKVEEEEEAKEDEDKVMQKKVGDKEEENEEKKKKKATAKNLGLDVLAYDCNGRRYHIMCRFLSRSGGYCIKGVGWRRFLENNDLHQGIVSDVHIELWAFRSHKLALGFTDQPDGALGLVILYHRQGSCTAEEAPEEDPLEKHGAVAEDVYEPADDIQGEAAADFTPNEVGAAAGLLFLRHEK